MIGGECGNANEEEGAALEDLGLCCLVVLEERCAVRDSVAGRVGALEVEVEDCGVWEDKEALPGDLDGGIWECVVWRVLCLCGHVHV